MARSAPCPVVRISVSRFTEVGRCSIDVVSFEMIPEDDWSIESGPCRGDVRARARSRRCIAVRH